MQSEKSLPPTGTFRFTITRAGVSRERDCIWMRCESELYSFPIFIRHEAETYAAKMARWTLECILKAVGKRRPMNPTALEGVTFEAGITRNGEFVNVEKVRGVK